MPIALKPLLNINEHDIVSFFSFSGAIPQTKGVLVTVLGSGWSNPINPVVPQGNLAGTSAQSIYAGAGQNRFNQAYSPLWVVPQSVGLSQPGDRPLGVLLYDVKELGFLAQPLRFDPVRRAEAQCVLSGEAVQVVRAGMFLISGINLVTGTGAGTGLLANPTNSGIKADISGGYVVTSSYDPFSVGQILGAPDRDGFILVDIDCRR
jgi:hypothetical protein